MKLTRSWRPLLPCFLVTVASVAFAQEPPAPPPPLLPSPPGVTDVPPTSQAPTEKKKKEADDWGIRGENWEVKGRVFSRAAFSRTELTVGPTSSTNRGIDFSVPSARAGIKYKVADRVTLNIEADVADRPLLRDGFVQAKSKRLTGRLGQFKLPVSSINLESPWNLPVARRGVINNLLGDHMQVIGRRPGILGAVQGGGSLDPELALGVFQGALDANTDLIEFEERALDSHVAAARLSITPGGQEVALVGVRTTTDVAQELRHFWSGGADTTLDFAFGLRAWAEFLIGTSYVVVPLDDGSGFRRPTARYWSGRAIAAWRWGGAANGDGYVEPFAYLGLLDPDHATSDDLVSEVFAGVNVGYWRRTRLTLQLEKSSAGDGVPSGVFAGNQVISDRIAVLLQAGAAF